MRPFGGKERRARQKRREAEKESQEEKQETESLDHQRRGTDGQTRKRPRLAQRKTRRVARLNLHSLFSLSLFMLSPVDQSARLNFKPSRSLNSRRQAEKGERITTVDRSQAAEQSRAELTAVYRF